MKKIGIIAGGGLLPQRLIEACERRDIDPFVVAFDGATAPETYAHHNHILTRIGAAGLIINTLKSHHIADLVFIGGVRRPTLRDLRPDLRALPFFLRMALRSLGDDGLLKAMRKELEREGFSLHPIYDFVPELLAGQGPLGARDIHDGDCADITRAAEILRVLSPCDVGQAVVMQAGLVLGVEAAEGTDALIERCGGLKRPGRGPILVKMAKVGQDEALDMPTIGPETVARARDAGFSGIVIESRRTLVLDPDRVAALADEAGMYVVAITNGQK